MATNTENYNLVVPEGTDLPDITELNGNWETIDDEMKRLSDEIANNAVLAEINDKIGQTTDTGGTTNAGSVFAKLNKLISDLATHMGRWTSARASSIDTIASMVSTNNTPNAEGTLSQKLSKLVQDVAKIPTTSVSAQKSYQSHSSIYLVSQNTTNTILNVSGAGQFHGAFGEYLDSTYCSAITVTMDGQQYDITIPESGKYLIRSAINEDAPNPLTIRDTLANAYDMPIPLYFKEQLTIQVRTTNKSPFYVTVNYDLLV